MGEAAHDRHQADGGGNLVQHSFGYPERLWIGLSTRHCDHQGGTSRSGLGRNGALTDRWAGHGVG
jgi:hypothetical protein